MNKTLRREYAALILGSIYGLEEAIETLLKEELIEAGKSLENFSKENAVQFLKENYEIHDYYYLEGYLGGTQRFYADWTNGEFLEDWDEEIYESSARWEGIEDLPDCIADSLEWAIRTFNNANNNPFLSMGEANSQREEMVRYRDLWKWILEEFPEIKMTEKLKKSLDRADNKIY